MQSAENGTKGYVYGEEECVLGRKKRDCRVLGDAERADALERAIWTNVGEGELGGRAQTQAALMAFAGQIRGRPGV